MKKEIEATVSYWRDPGDGSLPDPEHDCEIILGHLDEENRTMLIKDIRGYESSYSLDVQGFTVQSLPKKERDVTDQDIVGGEYFKELSDMVKTVTGAKDVLFFGKIIRGLARGALEARDYKGKKIQPPAPRPHVDFAPDYAELNVCTMAPGAAELLKNSSRFQILGVWKPIKLVQRDPLVFADWRTVPDSDYLNIVRDKTWPGKGLVASTVKHGAESAHQWLYLSDMTPEEVFLFKHFDSKKDMGAWRCAHTSVEIPGTENLSPRESVEVRALVVF